MAADVGMALKQADSSIIKGGLPNGGYGDLTLPSLSISVVLRGIFDSIWIFLCYVSSDKSGCFKKALEPAKIKGLV